MFRACVVHLWRGEVSLLGMVPLQYTIIQYSSRQICCLGSSYNKCFRGWLFIRRAGVNVYLNSSKYSRQVRAVCFRNVIKDIHTNTHTWTVCASILFIYLGVCFRADMIIFDSASQPSQKVKHTCFRASFCSWRLLLCLEVVVSPLLNVHLCPVNLCAWHVSFSST